MEILYRMTLASPGGRPDKIGAAVWFLNACTRVEDTKILHLLPGTAATLKSHFVKMKLAFLLFKSLRGDKLLYK